MLPNIKILDKEITPYAICAIVGLLVAGFWAVFCLRKTRHRDKDIDFVIVLLISLLGVFAGGALLYFFTRIPTMIKLIGMGYGIINSILFAFGGSVFYGGLFGGLTVGLITCKIMKTNPNTYIDVVAFMIPLFHVFGRIGCFLSGCCYGMESKFGFVYHHSPIPPANGVTRFPVQLAESAGNLIIFLVIYFLWRKVALKSRNHPLEYKLLGVYFVAYPIMRFTLEFFRGDTYRGIFLGISTSQLVSVLALILGIFLLLRKPVPVAEEQSVEQSE